MTPQRDYLHTHLRCLPIHRAMVRAVEAQLFADYAPHLLQPVLDIGSGDGSFAHLVFPRSSLIGIDPNLDDTREAHQRGVYRGLCVASGAALPFRDATFASVISNCVLEHIAPLDTTLREIARVLRPGGLFVASVVGHRFAYHLLGSALLRAIGLDGSLYGRWFNHLSRHIHTLSAAGWAAHFARAGLSVTVCRPYLNPAALKLFDLSHYWGAPGLLTRRILKRWFLYPPLSPNLLWEPLLRRLSTSAPLDEAPYSFFVCCKSHSSAST
jgi:SAM-dependent methyltransferase